MPSCNNSNRDETKNLFLHRRNISYGHKRDEYKGALQKKYMGVDDCQIFTNTVKYCTNKSEVIAQFRTFSKQVDEDIFK